MAAPPRGFCAAARRSLKTSIRSRRRRSRGLMRPAPRSRDTRRLARRTRPAPKRRPPRRRPLPWGGLAGLVPGCRTRKPRYSLSEPDRPLAVCALAVVVSCSRGLARDRSGPDSESSSSNRRSTWFGVSKPRESSASARLTSSSTRICVFARVTMCDTVTTRPDGVKAAAAGRREVRRPRQQCEAI